MGIASLLPTLKSISRPSHVGDAYGGRAVAVDAYVWLHRGAYACSREALRGRADAETRGLLFESRACASSRRRAGDIRLRRWTIAGQGERGASGDGIEREALAKRRNTRGRETRAQRTTITCER